MIYCLESATSGAYRNGSYKVILGSAKKRWEPELNSHALAQMLCLPAVHVLVHWQLSLAIMLP